MDFFANVVYIYNVTGKQRMQEVSNERCADGIVSQR